MPTTNNATSDISAPNGFVPEPDTVYDDTNACLVLDLFDLLEESTLIRFYKSGCVTDYELLEKVAAIVNKRVDPIGLIDHNTGLRKGA